MAHWLLRAGNCASLAFAYSYFGKVDASDRTAKWDFNWDRKGLLEKRSSTPVVSTVSNNIFLIRHGHYNVAGETDATKDLTSLGQEQAMATGLRLKSMNFPYKRIIHSSLTRAVSTASLLQHYLKIPRDCCPFLNECIPIAPDPIPANYTFELPKEENRFLQVAYQSYFECPGANDLCNKYDIIVAHANVIRYFICRSLQIPPNMWIRFSLYHCSITWIEILGNGSVCVRSVGDGGHIPASMLTG